MTFQIGNTPGRKTFDFYPGFRNIMLFEINTYHGLRATIGVTIRDSKGNLYWKKISKYHSKQDGRNKNISEYLDNNCKLLKGEIEFAETIASDFIESIVKGIGQGGKGVQEDNSEEKVEED
jgi:hypothetical protein